MAEALTTPLAEALVKIRMVYDGANVKSETKRAVDDQTKVYKQQMTHLRKESRALISVGREIGKVGELLMIASGLGAGGMLWEGIKTYMKTTEVGAEKLRQAMNGLHKSYEQFLARIGKAVTQSGLLAKVVERLKGFLDSLNEEKILKILNYAKWTAVLGVIMKITGELIKWTGEISKFQLHLSHLGIGGGLEAGIGGALGGATPLMAKLMGSAMRSGPRTTTGFQTVGGGGFFIPKQLSWLEKETKNLTTQFAKLGSVLGSIWNKVGGVLTFITKAFVVFDVLAGMVNAFGFKFEDGFDLIWTVLKGIGRGFEFLTTALTIGGKAFMDLFADLGALLAGDSSFSRLAEDQKALGNAWDALWGKTKATKDEPMAWLNKGTSKSSFTGLIDAAQEMITKENEIKILERIAEATEKTADKVTAPISNVSNVDNRSGSPFFPSWSMAAATSATSSYRSTF